MKDDIDLAIDKCHELFEQIIDKHAPMKIKE